jgi:hypothetical protein
MLDAPLDAQLIVDGKWVPVMVCVVTTPPGFCFYAGSCDLVMDFLFFFML